MEGHSTISSTWSRKNWLIIILWISQTRSNSDVKRRKSSTPKTNHDSVENHTILSADDPVTFTGAVMWLSTLYLVYLRLLTFLANPSNPSICKSSRSVGSEIWYNLLVIEIGEKEREKHGNRERNVKLFPCLCIRRRTRRWLAYRLERVPDCRFANKSRQTSLNHVCCIGTSYC